MPTVFTRLSLDGLILIEPSAFHDGRGFFLESYKKSEYAAQGIDGDFVQDNYSFSTWGVLRGLHYQLPPRAQGKIVRVIEGTVWDVAIDIRPDSHNFKRWEGVELSGTNKRALWIPPGFAHGFISLSETAYLLYKCTAEYDKDSEAGIRWDDPGLAISWPMKPFIVSDKDALLPSLGDAPLFRTASK